MPAVSKAQQRLFGLVKAVKAGDVKASAVSPEVKKIAKDMSKKEIDKFAATKHKDLPEKKKKTEESLRSLIRNIVSETLREDTNEFDFEDFDDTDLSGSSIEIAIEDLLGEFQNSIDTVLRHNSALKSKARIAIKKMIMDKIKNWR